MSITCIANSGSDGSIEVPFYDCPCAVCTKMEWELRYEEDQSLAEHRNTQFPEHWDIRGRVRTDHPFAKPAPVGVMAQLRSEPDEAKHAHLVAGLLRLIIAQPRGYTADERNAILSDAAWLLDRVK